MNVASFAAVGGRIELEELVDALRSDIKMFEADPALVWALASESIDFR